MPKGTRESERVDNFYRVMCAVESKAEYDEETGYTLTMRDFRNAVTGALFIVGRRSINDWVNKCVDLGFIVKLGATGNLHYSKENWRNSPIYKAAKAQIMEQDMADVQLIDARRSR